MLFSQHQLSILNFMRIPIAANSTSRYRNTPGTATTVTLSPPTYRLPSPSSQTSARESSNTASLAHRRQRTIPAAPPSADVAAAFAALLAAAVEDCAFAAAILALLPPTDGTATCVDKKLPQHLQIHALVESEQFINRSCKINAAPCAINESLSISPTRIPPPFALPLTGCPVNEFTGPVVRTWNLSLTM